MESKNYRKSVYIFSLYPKKKRTLFKRYAVIIGIALFQLSAYYTTYSHNANVYYNLFSLLPLHADDQDK
jgi:hypothetical protein